MSDKNFDLNVPAKAARTKLYANSTNINKLNAGPNTQTDTNEQDTEQDVSKANKNKLHIQAGHGQFEY